MQDHYQVVAIYDSEGEFIGYAIHKVGTKKLSGTNLWDDDERDALAAQLERLNEGADITLHWPRGDDPEFLALLRDPNFHPIEYTIEDVVDDEKLERMVEAGLIDVYLDPVSGNTYWSEPEKVPTKRAKVPKDPAAPTQRYRKAAETVALRRMRASD